MSDHVDVLAQRKGPQTAALYLNEIDTLTAKVEASSKTTTTTAPSSGPFWLADVTPYAPFVVSGFLFVAAFIIMVLGKAHDAKRITSALLVALFAASIPQMLFRVEKGFFGAQASPQEVPRYVRVQAVSRDSVRITWETGKKTVGAVRYSLAPFDIGNTKIAVGAQSQETFHEIIISFLSEGKTYDFDVLSGTVWYDDDGKPIQFVK